MTVHVEQYFRVWNPDLSTVMLWPTDYTVFVCRRVVVDLLAANPNRPVEYTICLN